LLEKSKNLELNSRKFWSYNPRMKKCSIKIYSEKDVVSSPSKPMLASWILWKNSLLRMRNPRKLLEKSKSLEINPRKFWSYYHRMEKCSIKIYSKEDVVSSPSKRMLALLVEFCGKIIYYVSKTIKISWKINASWTYSQGNLVLIHLDEKIKYQDLLGRRCKIFSIKDYACWLNF
jgi:hypothetical protein